MKVTRLKLANLRAIQAAEFRFQPGFNLIVGINGVGKTSGLDALSVCLSAIVKQSNRLRVPVGAFTVDDIRIEPVARSLPLGNAQRTELPTVDDESSHERTNDFMRASERDGLAHEIVGHIRGQEQT